MRRLNNSNYLNVDFGLSRYRNTRNIDLNVSRTAQKKMHPPA